MVTRMRGEEASMREPRKSFVKPKAMTASVWNSHIGDIFQVSGNHLINIC